MDGKIKYISMFTGVGGFDLGIEKANNFSQYAKEKCDTTKFIEESESRRTWTSDETRWNDLQPRFRKQSINRTFKCVGFSEIDKYCNQLLKQKWPNITNFGDCTKINPYELPDFDMLCGGFPCQAFSIAGKRRGFEDTRGTMFFEIARILEVKRPKIVFLENVKGLLNHDKGNTFTIILETLDELGYETQWMVLNSKFFGVPQNRERVFIIGHLRGESRKEILPFRNNNKEIDELQGQSTNTIKARHLADANGSYVIERKQLPQADRVYDTKGISPTIPTATDGRHIPTIVASRGRDPLNPSDRTIGSPKEQRLEINKEGISNSLTSFQKDNLVFDEKIRRLTPLECLRLQGFPDDWLDGLNFSDTSKYKMMGNAVTVNVVQAIAEKLIRNIY